MVGCMLESKLGVATSLEVTSSFSNVKYTDLDVFTYPSKQSFNGGQYVNNGMHRSLDRAGFSIKLNNVF